MASLLVFIEGLFSLGIHTFSSFDSNALIVQFVLPLVSDKVTLNFYGLPPGCVPVSSGELSLFLTRRP
jgi:hypothetical protein